MTTRDLAIVTDGSDTRERDARAADERYTRASEVEVYRCVFEHTEDEGCTGLPGLCGLDDWFYREFVRIAPAYTYAELRAIQRVEWGDWWKARRQNDGV